MRMLIPLFLAGFWSLAAKEEGEHHLRWVYALAGAGAWFGGFALAGFLGGLLGQGVLVAIFIARKARKERERTGS
jgi:hypothetical protein